MKTGIGGFGEPIFKQTVKLGQDENILCYAEPILESLSKYSNYTFNSVEDYITWGQITELGDLGETVNIHKQLDIIGVKNE